jgi:uncharacterized protein YceK
MRHSSLPFAVGVSVILTLSLLLNGCATILSRYASDDRLTYDPPSDPSPSGIYGGTRAIMGLLVACPKDCALFIWDLPFSFASDTLLLPLTIYEQFAGNLLKAASRGDVDAVNAMLAKGADINETYDHGRTALMYAAWNSHIAVVQLLLDRGADVDAKDQYGNTALTIATRRGHTEVVQLLINPGAKERLY